MNTRALRTYLADCASFALAITDQQSQAPAFAVRIMCNHEAGEYLFAAREHVNQALHAAEQACINDPTTISLQHRLYAWRLCAWCLCDDEVLPLQARLAHQLIAILL